MKVPNDLISTHPTVTFFVVIVFSMLSFVTLVSKKVAEAGGALGAVARGFKKWRQRAIDEDRDVLAGRVKRLEDEVRRIDHENTLQHDYIVYVVGWVHRVELWAAQNGYTLPPPEFLTFAEWKAQRETT